MPTLEESLNELREAQGKVREAQRDVDSRAIVLAPQIAAHFEAYIRNEVSPLLPQGYAIDSVSATDVEYKGGLFTLKLPKVNTPYGVMGANGERGNLDMKVLSKIWDYKKEATWVFNVRLGFNLPK